ncbi:sensor histidine kinase [Corynebacterium mayonis]|uniref:sensor histidine kinase n=1 Tax=Corynebacterium mayonis TaxID=3062461 RepID=UPI0031400E3C
MSRIFNPATRWRNLDSAGKFLVYNRWSLQGTVIIIAVFLGLGARSMWAAAAIVASAFSAVVALHYQPVLRLKEIPRRPFLSAAGFTLNAVFLFASLPTAQLNVACMSLIILISAFTPFFRLWQWWTLAVCVAGVLVIAVGLGSPALAVLSIVCGSVTLVVLWTVRLMTEVHRARTLEARLRVSEERLRFAQDLHDTLGQNLAGMSIKTQLALKFAQRGDARLTTELTELQSLIDATVTDMHGVVDNYRSADFIQEINGAVTLLKQAGITVTVEGSAAEVAPAFHPTAAWFIRETATNVLRHSRATTAALSISPQRIALSNDGPDPPGSGPSGAGLDGLRRRASESGSRLRVEHSPTLFTAALELP